MTRPGFTRLKLYKLRKVHSLEWNAGQAKIPEAGSKQCLADQRLTASGLTLLHYLTGFSMPLLRVFMGRASMCNYFPEGPSDDAARATAAGIIATAAAKAAEMIATAAAIAAAPLCF